MKTILEELSEAISNMLIAAGTVGIKQSVLVARFRHVSAAEVVHELELLLAEDKVQRFQLKRVGGGTPTIWRATEKIMEPRVIKPVTKPRVLKKAKSK